MSLLHGIEIWLCVAVVLGLAACAYDGWTGHDDPVAGVVLAILWPAWVTLAVIAGPFWLAYKLGDKTQEFLSSLPKEKTHEG